MKKLLLKSSCGALYDPTILWARGHWSGTSTAFTPTRNVPAGACPVCMELPIRSTSNNGAGG